MTDRNLLGSMTLGDVLNYIEENMAAELQKKANASSLSGYVKKADFDELEARVAALEPETEPASGET